MGVFSGMGVEIVGNIYIYKVSILTSLRMVGGGRGSRDILFILPALVPTVRL